MPLPPPPQAATGMAVMAGTAVGMAIMDGMAAMVGTAAMAGTAVGMAAGAVMAAAAGAGGTASGIGCADQLRTQANNLTSSVAAEEAHRFPNAKGIARKF